MKSKNYVVNILFIILSLLWFFAKFFPIDITALTLFSFINNKNFANDMQITFTNFRQTTIYFDLFKFFHQNDLYRLLLHYISSIVSVYFFYKFFYQNLKFNHLQSLIGLICLYNLDHFLLVDTKSAIVPFDNGYQSSFAAKLLGPAIYYGVNNKTFRLIVILIFGNLISLKTMLFPSVIILTVHLFNNKNFFFKFAPFISILIVYFYFKNEFIVNESYDRSLFLTESIINRGANEITIFLQLKKQVIIFFLSIPIYIFFIYKKNIKIKYLNEIILILSIILIIIGEIYYNFLYKVFPDPRAASFSVVRNLLVYQLFFIINLIVFVYNYKTSNITKILIFGFIVNFNFGPSYAINLKLSIIFCLFFVFSHLFFLKKKNNFDINNYSKFYLLIVFFLPNFIYLYKTHSNIFHYEIFIKEKIFYTDIKSLRLYDKLKKISNCRDDFQLIALEFDTKKNLYNHTTSANFFSKKSSFFVDRSTVWKYQDHLEVINNSKLINDLLFFLNTKLINQNFSKYSVIQSINDTDIKKILGIKQNLYIIFSDGQEFYEFNKYLIKNCS